ncbi:hypothetical protein FACS189431_3420 [Alphaproteobacteria bacterium]|nr:hypothetical protein FACS189431_3420 [Alphaproteobacteria bacterium]
MTENQHIYIDESGDLGLVTTRSSRFIVAGVVLFDSETNKIIDGEISKYRKSLNWNEMHEFHFKSIKKQIVADLLTKLNDSDYSAYALIIDKQKYAKSHAIKDEKVLYRTVLINLLNHMPLKNVSILIDGKFGKKHKKELTSKIRQNLKSNGITVRKIDTIDSRKSNGVQLADLVAGSVARSYNTQKPDAKKYVKILGNKLTIFEE